MARRADSSLRAASPGGCADFGSAAVCASRSLLPRHDAGLFAAALDVDLLTGLQSRVDRLRDGDEAAGLPAIVRHNGWGEFVLRGYRLRGGGGPTTRLGILIEQLVPYESHLLERVNATGLTMRQKEIVLLSVQGVANAQIARRLGISPHTLKDHQKDIYQRLDINSHHELVERLASAAVSVVA